MAIHMALESEDLVVSIMKFIMATFQIIHCIRTLIAFSMRRALKLIGEITIRPAIPLARSRIHLASMVAPVIMLHFIVTSVYARSASRAVFAKCKVILFVRIFIARMMASASQETLIWKVALPGPPVIVAKQVIPEHIAKKACFHVIQTLVKMEEPALIRSMIIIVPAQIIIMAAIVHKEFSLGLFSHFIFMPNGKQTRGW